MRLFLLYGVQPTLIFPLVLIDGVRGRQILVDAVGMKQVVPVGFQVFAGPIVPPDLGIGIFYDRFGCGGSMAKTVKDEKKHCC